MSDITQILKSKKRKFIKDLGGRVLWKFENLIARHSKVPTTPVLDPSLFPWTALLEKNGHTIRDELDEILRFKAVLPRFQDISKDQTSITDDEHWKTYFLYGFGYKSEANCARCPVTARVIEQIPGLLTAFFSILDPGKHIPEHRGVYKGILRYHLGVKMPEPATGCGIRIEDRVLHWEEGKSLLFDDTYRHEAWNDTSGIRVVLLIDVLRPLDFPVNLLNRSLVNLVKRTGYVQDARKNQEAWERRFAAFENNRSLT